MLNYTKYYKFVNDFLTFFEKNSYLDKFLYSQGLRSILEAVEGENGFFDLLYNGLDGRGYD